jgi:hypothetical protein
MRLAHGRMPSTAGRLRGSLQSASSSSAERDGVTGSAGAESAATFSAIRTDLWLIRGAGNGTLEMEIPPISKCVYTAGGMFVRWMGARRWHRF